MGCEQSSTNAISPQNHIPIDRLYLNDDYSTVQPTPVVAITAPPTPAYIKSALKRNPSDGRGRTEKIPLFTRKPPPLTKAVSFDTQVLVKARTPTPSKIWYEKASSTMPMRKHRRNDDNDYDYDDEEVSSDEEQENNVHSDTEPRKFTIRPATPLKRNQTNAFRPVNDTSGFEPSTNPMEQGEYFSPMVQQPSHHPHTYATDTPTSSSANRIKVRRRLPDLAPPQIAPIPLYRSPLQTSIVLPSQSPLPTTAVSVYPDPAQALVVSPYRSPVQPSAFSPYQSPTQSLPVPSYQSLIYGTLPQTNPVLQERRPVLANDESSPQTTHHTINRHPVENIT